MLLETTDSLPQAPRPRRPRIVEEIVEYQPIMGLRDGAVRGFAASLRRRRLGTSGSDARWVMLHACIEARYWPGCRMSVKVSAQHLGTDLLDQIDAALAMSGLPARHFELELTDIEAGPPVCKAVQALRERGVGVVLSRFGIRGAGLSLLRNLPLTAVKLDRSLVRGLPVGDACSAVRTALADAHKTGLLVIADGVENLAQRDFLTRMGGDEAQGPLYSRALRPERLAALLHYGVDTCPAPRSGSETLYDRAVPH